MPFFWIHSERLLCFARICAMLLMSLILGHTTTKAADSKPNFVFVYADDHRWDALGVMQREQGERARFPWLKTPGLDRLAAEGVRFRNAFVTLSLCAPSRAAYLTGQYNHVNASRIIVARFLRIVSLMRFCCVLLVTKLLTLANGTWEIKRVSDQALITRPVLSDRDNTIIVRSKSMAWPHQPLAGSMMSAPILPLTGSSSKKINPSPLSSDSRACMVLAAANIFLSDCNNCMPMKQASLRPTVVYQRSFIERMGIPQASPGFD